MNIGTPLSDSATRVMLLGSGELGKEVIIALQRLGVEVIAVDRYQNAPGHQVAHRAHVIDMSDLTATTQIDTLGIPGYACFTPDGSYAVMGENHVGLGVYETVSWKRRMSFYTYPGINCLACSPDSRFAAAGIDGRILLWQLP